MAYKPDGYTTVSPYLVSSNATATIEFAIRVLGGKEIQRHTGEQGRVMHAEVRIDDTVLMIADGTEGWPALPTHVHVYVPDVDATYRRALDAGATSIQDPVRKGDPDKRGGVRDIGGISWWIATHEG